MAIDHAIYGTTNIMHIYERMGEKERAKVQTEISCLCEAFHFLNPQPIIDAIHETLSINNQMARIIVYTYNNKLI